MEGARAELPTGTLRVARAQSKRGLDPRKAVLGAAEIHLQETGERMGQGIVRVQRDRSFILRDRRSELPFRVVNSPLSK